MGNTVYLAPAPTGDDTRTYAQAQNIATPWATPGQVQAGAVTGDTVQMAAGTYTFASIAFTKDFTWIGALLNGTPTTLLDGGGGVVEWNVHNLTTSIKNIVFQNVVLGGNNAVFKFSAASSPTTLTMTNCIVKTLTFPAAYGSVFGAPLNAPTATITINVNNCLFNDIVGGVGTGDSTSITLVNYAGCTYSFTGCTFDFRTSANSFQYVFSYAGVLVLKNCIIRNATGNVMTFQNGLTSAAGTYSDFYLITTSPAGTGNITSDPLFVDAPNANFNLRPTSPCLGTGIIA